MNQQVKVLMYSEKWTTGGIESVIMNIYRNLSNKKVKVDILTSQNETDIYDDEIKQLGGEKRVTLQEKYESPIARTLKNFKKFSDEIKKNDYDIIHLHICHGVAMIYAFLAKKAGIKHVIVHSHNTDIGNKHKTIKTIAHLFSKYLFERYADEYFACSDLAAKWLYTKKTLKAGKVKIINNAIDAKKFVFNKLERNKFREDLNINDKFVVGHIGRFGEQKNHLYLVDIFEEIHNINKNSILLLVGNGELKQKIEKKVNDKGLNDSVIFYGETQDIPKVLFGMDVFVLPSLFEGKPVVAIETQAASLKTYLSDTITKTVKISEYVDYLSIKEDAKKWAQEIINTGKDYERKDMYGVLVENNYDIKKVAKDMEELYITMAKGEKNV